MSRYDDDYDDNEDERDDDEAEDDDGVRRSTSNPFSNRPNSVRGAGLPQQQRPQPNQGGSVPSPIRSGGMGNNGQGSSFLNRPGTPPGGSSGAQPYQRTPAPTRPLSDDKKDDSNDRSAAVNRVLGSFGQKLGEKPEEKKDEKSTNPFGSRFGSGDRPEDRSSGVGGLTRGLGANTTRLGDEKPSGGLSSRFGGGSEKKDDKPSGGGIGGLASRFGGGKKDDKDKKDDKSSSGGLGGLSSRFGGEKKDEKKENKPSGGGIGGLASRFGGGKKDDKPAASSFGASRLGDQSANRQSPLGSALGGSKPQSGTFGSASRSSPFGGSSTTGKPTTKTPAPSLGDRFKGIFGGGKKDQRPAARSRTSKAPRVDQGGLSLDHKLDILGITLLLGSLVLLLSSLSPTKGALTASINYDLSYAFGWGAVFVLGILFAIGLWLILRHFGDEAPVISRTRLIGVAMLFLGALVLAQFIDAFQYKVGPGQDYLATLQMVFLPIAYSLGRGGGWVGGQIYFQLISNFTEIGGFMVLIGWLIVGLMLALSLSASDLAMIVISNGRNFSDVLRQRRQRAAAVRAAQQQTLATATQQISISKPAETLPAAAPSPALPAPTAEEQRRIPITTAGRTSTVPFRPNETAEAVAADADAQPVPVAQEKSGLFSRVRGVLPGVKSLDDKTPAPVENPVPAPVEKLAPAQTAGGLRARFLRGRAEAAPAPVTPQAPTAAQSISTTPPVQPPLQQPAAAQTVTPAQPTTPQLASAQQLTPPPTPTTPRLGDLLGRSAQSPTPQPTTPASPSGVQPFQRPPLTRPDSPAERKPAEAAGRADAPRAPQPMPDLQSRMRALREVADAPPKPAEPSRPAPSPAFGKPSDPPFAMPQRSDITPPPPPRRPARDWKMPDPSALLSSGVDEAPDHEMLLKRAHIIEETLSSFGAPGRVVDVRTGPVVTQFGVEPDYVPGRGGKKNRVKVGAIAALDKDLQLALGAKSIRIEAPVPGKGYVGVEVPNEKAEIVHLRDVLEAQEFKKIRSPLAIALGQGVDGTPVAADLGVMPHLLIAGTTGSGKSVCVNAIIASLLLNNTPRIMKFIMVDPKRVELTQYNGVPHLVAPVVVELERIVSVLKWVTREMDERYRKFSNAAARNIEDYNKHLPSTEEPMPYIVVIIDELADLMMLAPDETERVITRIAALARATGIHLVIATQRPSVDVVTGLIKANFPARIAFAVAANTDSRVILDQPGAERLLGRGDMLYMSGDAPAPVRLQGVFVSDTEIGNITRFWRGQMSDDDLIAAARPIGASLSPEDGNRSDGGVILRSNPPAPARTTQTQAAFWDTDDEDEDDQGDDDEGVDGEDEMYDQAVELVRRLNKASVSLLQRRLRIGYTRAARLIDVMEERGIVGPATEGSKPREVLPVR